MKLKNRVGALVLSALMSMSLAACGGSGDGGDGGGAGGTSDPLVTAMENMDKVSSMDAKMVMEMDMTAGDQSLESVTTMDMSMFNDPLRMKANMTMDMGGYGDVSMEIYAEEAEDKSIVMYLYDGMDWYAQDATTADLEQYDVSSSLDFYMDSTTGFKQEGTEDLDGVSAYKYTGVITGEAMQEVMMSSGALDSLGTTMSMDESQMDEMLSGLGDITVTLWIDEENLYPIRYDMDMTAIMDGLVSSMLESMGSDAEGLTMSIPKMTISMTCSNFNNATDFTIPEEAKNA